MYSMPERFGTTSASLWTTTVSKPFGAISRAIGDLGGGTRDENFGGHFKCCCDAFGLSKQRDIRRSREGKQGASPADCERPVGVCCAATQLLPNECGAVHPRGSRNGDSTHRRHPCREPAARRTSSPRSCSRAIMGSRMMPRPSTAPSRAPVDEAVEEQVACRRVDRQRRRTRQGRLFDLHHRAARRVWRA